MKDLPLHLLLFAFMGLSIVVLGAMFSEREDGPLFAGLPKRLGWFFLGCGVLAGVMLLAEHTVAAVH